MNPLTKEWIDKAEGDFRDQRIKPWLRNFTNCALKFVMLFEPPSGFKRMF